MSKISLVILAIVALACMEAQAAPQIRFRKCGFFNYITFRCNLKTTTKRTTTTTTEAPEEEETPEDPPPEEESEDPPPEEPEAETPPERRR